MPREVSHSDLLMELENDPEAVAYADMSPAILSWAAEHIPEHVRWDDAGPALQVIHRALEHPEAITREGGLMGAYRLLELEADGHRVLDPEARSQLFEAVRTLRDNTKNHVLLGMCHEILLDWS